MSLLPGRRVRWAALGAIVGALAVGGIALADIPDSGVIHGCYKTTGGALRVIDSSQGSNCNPGESPIGWNQTGPTGATGANGDTGPTGPTGPSGSNHAYSAQSSAVSIDTGPAVFPTQIITSDVPPGNYVVAVSGDFALANSSTSPFAECELDPDMAATLFLHALDTTASYSIVGLVSLPGGGTIVLSCDSPTNTQGSSVFFDDNSLVATKVDAIN
jgi:hypothetical protein